MRRLDLEDLSCELDNVSMMLGALAYDLEDNKPPYCTIETTLFTACNLLDRIVEDMRVYDREYDAMKKKLAQPHKMTEETRTIKTLYL